MEYQTRTIRHGSCTLIVHRPELSDAERAKREQAVRETLARELRSYTTRKDTKQ